MSKTPKQLSNSTEQSRNRRNCTCFQRCPLSSRVYSVIVRSNVSGNRKALLGP